MVKVLVVMALAAVVLGMGVHYGRDRVVSAIHQRIDTGLPDEVEAHPWSPVAHGKPGRPDRVRFSAGTVTTLRCHASLGSYSLHIDHGFTFQPAPTPVKAGCPGRALRTALTQATWAGVEDHDKSQHLVLTDGHGHTVATLRGRGD